jgi:hypothetical protein
MVSILKKETLKIGDQDFPISVDLFRRLPDPAMEAKQKIYLAESVYFYEKGTVLGAFESAEDACQSCLKAVIEGRYADAWTVTEYVLGEYELFHELRLLGATEVILSTNIELTQKGLPYSNRRQPDDPGVAVFFKLKKQSLALACDKWDRVADNVWAIALHINAIRGQSRWGVGTIEQAFMGYAALPAATMGRLRSVSQ